MEQGVRLVHGAKGEAGAWSKGWGWCMEQGVRLVHGARGEAGAWSKG